jgi:integrase/recombinase XerC
MKNMRKPKLSEEVVPVIGEDDLRKVLHACEGRSFENRRDTAIVRVFIDTGARLSEIANLRMEDITEHRGGWEMHVTGKGRVSRLVALGRRTTKALDRYNRARSDHKEVSSARRGGK